MSLRNKKQRPHGLPTPETADGMFRRLLREQVDVVLKNEERTQKSSAKGLHDIRIAFRRMRTLAVTFGELDPVFLKRLDRQIAKVCDALGAARDLDVWMDLFRSLIQDGELDGISPKEQKSILAFFRLDRARLAHAAVEADEYRKVKQKLAGYLADDPPVRKKKRPSAMQLVARRTLVVRKLIASRYRQVGHFSKGPAHDLRRAGRRLRYLAEFFAQDISAEYVRAGHWITKAQAALGKVHDDDSALELTRHIPSGKTRAAVRKVLHKHRREQIRKFKSAWRRYADKPLQKKWAAQLDALSAE
ncbi:MAG: CHAD domain-containing protein [Verrucomicrobiota bacterium]|jgi:CHAD domain-containing protein|nr:CHAD domain-containing protein [Verrucomicrobiota bacterium]